jgi:truncated hemoglobin YjbI
MMSQIDFPKFPTRHGYMSEKIQRDYITSAIETSLMPDNAHRVAEIVSLTASSNTSKPIQFWQLFSVLGHDPIVQIVGKFYERVFDDEDWFTSVFEKVGGIHHHINTQAAMWIDVMGGGPYYHGAEYRLSFHHTHNAIQLMNNKGAARWSQLMLETLDTSAQFMTDDMRVRTSINTFLTHFMGKYSQEFNFENRSFFGEVNGEFKQMINFMNLTENAINAFTENDLRTALIGRGIDVSIYNDKAELVRKALTL